MRTRPRRRFTMGDILVLVAATATGLGLARAANRSFPGFDSREILPKLWAWPACVAATWTLAWVPLRLHHPRPRLRRLARRPGSAAGFAAAAALTVGVLFWIAFVLFRADPPDAVAGHNFRWYSWQFWRRAGPAVLGGWAVLLVRCRRARGADWVDWLGLILGVYWSGWVVAGTIGPIIHRLSPTLF